MSYIEKEKLIEADIASIENRVRHAFNQGYDLGFKDGKKRAKPLELEPTTENCESCRYYGSHHEVCNYCYKCSLWTEKEPTTKNDLGIDLISRSEVLNRLASIAKIKAKSDAQKSLMGRCMFMVERMPSITPQVPKCKDCKWWKDSDGEYRRGCGAESQCPINRKEVFEGNGYCFLFEPQERENP